jgi:hypothetical protein
MWRASQRDRDGTKGDSDNNHGVDDVEVDDVDCAGN